VVPLDQSEEAKTALNIAVWLSLLFEARLLLLGISNREPKAVRQVYPAHRDITPTENRKSRYIPETI
jgi:hypothetical protein